MPRRPAALAALACACALATIALWFAVNDIALVRELDAMLGDRLHELGVDTTRELLQGASSLADPLAFAVGAAALTALAWLRGGGLLALVIASVLVAANVVTQILQPALAGSRTVDFAGTGLVQVGSWPSGHAVAAMLLALGAIVVAGPRLRAVTALAGLGFAAGVGGALVALGGHLPGDVLAGFLLAATFSAAGAGVYAALRGRAAQAGQRPDPARPPLIAPALGALAAGAFLATGLGKALVTRHDEVASAIDKAPLVLAATAAVTATALLGAGAALVLRR